MRVRRVAGAARRGVALALLAASAPPAQRVARPARADSAAIRRALQAQYDEMARAIEAKDVDRVRRLFSPLDIAAEDAAPRRRDAFARTGEVRMRIALDSIAVRGDTARVVYVEHGSVAISSGDSTRHVDVTNHEVAWWVRSKGVWLHQAFVRDRLPRRIERAERRRRAWPGDAEYASAPPGDDTAELLRLERSLGSADLHPGRATARWLDSALDARFVLTGASGRRIGRAEAIARWSKPDAASRAVASSLGDLRLVIAGDAAYVTSMSTERERRSAGDTTFRLRVTDVWARRDGRWRAVASHVNRVLDSAAAPAAAPRVLRVSADAAAADDSAAVVAVERRIMAASRPGGAAVLDSLLTDDFQATNTRGRTSDRAAAIARWTAAAAAGGWGEITGLDVVSLGGVAVVRLTDTAYDSTGGVEVVARSTDVLRKEGGRWRLAAIHVSRADAAVIAAEDSAAVAAAERAVLAASAAHDAAALDALLDSTFVGASASGAQFGRAATVARWTRPDTSGETSSLEDLVVRAGQGTALVEMVDVQHARDGRALRASRVADLWVRRGASWRLVAAGAVREPPRADAAADGGVRAARARWNAAAASLDTARLGALVADSVVQATPGFRRVGRDAYVLGFARVVAARPELVLDFAPVTVVGSPTTAHERGRWHERWNVGDEPVELSGDYVALWSRGAAGWRITAELFQPTACVGGAYCTR